MRRESAPVIGSRQQSPSPFGAPVPRLAHLVTTLAAPLPFSGADAAPHLEPRPTARLLVQRGNTELIVQKVQPPATASAVSFPAPWPRRFGTSAVSPAADLVVFAGPHALRAVDQSGSPRWELRHRCWARPRGAHRNLRVRGGQRPPLCQPWLGWLLLKREDPVGPCPQPSGARRPVRGTPGPAVREIRTNLADGVIPGLPPRETTTA